MSLQVLEGGGKRAPEEEEIRLTMPKEGVQFMPLPWRISQGGGEVYHCYMSMEAYSRVIMRGIDNSAEGDEEEIARRIVNAADKFRELIMPRMIALHDCFMAAAKRSVGQKFYHGLKYTVPIEHEGKTEMHSLVAVFGNDEDGDGAFHTILPEEVSPERPTLAELKQQAIDHAVTELAKKLRAMKEKKQ